ncbi:hypothetical protein K466DRAFT_589678 [Polyporus arcularius HHB13444]|uniref:Uncharacterized protein n=1 Tax=Polyporus arcularius HHB13444 TaxID=1314778 RepID=A0A5C3P5C7_9APHY|nr:hypothetical protein K466DRAFT_589678 [Polyporus arcularius HHB13444]
MLMGKRAVAAAPVRSARILIIVLRGAGVRSESPAGLHIERSDPSAIFDYRFSDRRRVIRGSIPGDVVNHNRMPAIPSLLYKLLLELWDSHMSSMSVMP